jgi:hypothetical protein
MQLISSTTREHLTMANATTGVGGVTDPVQKTLQHLHDAPTTELTPDETQSLARSRKVAFWALAICAVLAVLGAVYFWYLWVLTVKSCVNTYLVTERQTSMYIHPKTAGSWQDTFIGLDISSFSALTLALLFTRLAYGGYRNTIRLFWRDGWSYFGRAYHSVLFSEGFETLCVRFGLLGTLLSFLLAAVAQLATPSAVTAGVAGATMGDAATTATSELSSGIFLLLCASLVSTFVGTGVAYTITPSFNWLNERALGLHQMVRSDGSFAAEEFVRQVDLTSQRLGEFTKTITNLSASAEHIATFEESVGIAARKLAQLIPNLEHAVQTFEVSTQTGKQLTKKLDHLEGLYDRMTAMFELIPERFNDPLKNMSHTAGRFREAAQSGEAAFRELKSMAGSARESLVETTHRTNTTWQMLREVQESLKDLAANEATQTNEVSKLVGAFDAVGESLHGLVRGLESLGTHLQEGQTPGNEGMNLLTDERHVTGGRATLAGGDDGRGATRSGYGRPANAADPPRPWWRRLFG